MNTRAMMQMKGTEELTRRRSTIDKLREFCTGWVDLTVGVVNLRKGLKRLPSVLNMTLRRVRQSKANMMKHWIT